MIEEATSDEQRASIFASEADYYYDIACKSLKSPNKDNLRLFRKALSGYTLANRLDKHNTDSILGIGKCLLSLHKYTQALDHFKVACRDDNVLKRSDFWFFYGLSARKCSKIWLGDSVFSKKFENLEIAENALNRATDQIETGVEKKIVGNLKNLQNAYSRDIHSYIGSIKEASLCYDTTTVHKQRDFYKILSIDGSGIKGILPGLVLLEIEKRCNQHLTNVFDLFTGTGIGGVVACGLNVPLSTRSNRPLYAIADLMEMIFLRDYEREEAPKSLIQCLIHQNPVNVLTDAMRNIVKSYTMSQSVSELIIPTVRYDDVFSTHFFTRHAAKCNPYENVSMVDACLAASVIVTYAKPYKVKNLGCFFDGGQTTQSTCKKAYDEAINRFGKKKSEIFTLSLGTGFFASDFWDLSGNGYDSPEDLFVDYQAELTESILSNQVCSGETYLRAELGERFTRLDVNLENEVSMDFSVHTPDLLDIATEFIEEKDDEINRLVEVLLEH